MSRQNVEIVRSFLEADLDEAMAFVDPEIVWNPIEEEPASGHDAVRASSLRWKGEWDDYELVPEQLADLGDRVLATVRLRGRGRGSGVEVDARFYDLYTLRDGKIVRMDQFNEQAEALEAAGPNSGAESCPRAGLVALAKLACRLADAVYGDPDKHHNGPEERSKRDQQSDGHRNLLVVMPVGLRIMVLRGVYFLRLSAAALGLQKFHDFRLSSQQAVFDGFWALVDSPGAATRRRPASMALLCSVGAASSKLPGGSTEGLGRSATPRRRSNRGSSGHCWCSERWFCSAAPSGPTAETTSDSVSCGGLLSPGAQTLPPTPPRCSFVRTAAFRSTPRPRGTRSIVTRSSIS